MQKRKVIPEAAMVCWQELGIELGLSYGEITIISKNAFQKGAERCAKEMLEAWRQQLGSAATSKELIAAFQAIGHYNYAAVLQEG